MKGFKKLALVSAIAALPAGAVAMEAMDDSELSGVTGQDGISLSLDLDVNTDVFFEDTDGVITGTDIIAAGQQPYRASAGGNNFAFGAAVDQNVAGFIALENISVSGSTNITIDSGSTAGAGANTGVLNLRISVPNVTLGDAGAFTVGVVGSTVAAGEERNAVAGLARVVTSAPDVTDVVSIDSLSLSNLDMVVQLGPEAANFLYIESGGAGVVDISNINIIDVNGNNFAGNNGDDITISQLYISNMDLGGTVGAVTAAGLELTLRAGGAGTNQQVAMMGVQLGAAPAMGNIYLRNLDLSDTQVTIAGK